MPVEQTPTYQTSDGKYFTDEKLAADHETRLEDIARVEACASRQKFGNAAARTKFVNNVMAYLDDIAGRTPVNDQDTIQVE